ncbi:NAD(P)/FAD-dependent oxidoreductase [Amycolatopsis pithecellobii]|uniref:NAD(P)/FAD-dependent oxidoreductase n=1 Tax=Amycolatopsis pithecellobii TaxID=664692 RepID=A0A6N7YJB4_9PSEU|nr:FAD-dependent oxidoreductase [Amycolatopsis pithecellobii]MTD52995.1 NAD(P)/FAD-dependent oxidoreductase [Amycolatopsis pithecellobii]
MRPGNRAERIVVVGASVAGVTTADALRRHGYTGTLTLIGAEPHAAYNRPALSKGILTGTDTYEDIVLPPLSTVADQRLGARAVGLDVERREVLLADGDRVAYDKLAITTGARARRLAEFGVADPGVRETAFRDLDDARLLSQRLGSRPHVVIVGAGILGMELASACVHRGATVTVVDQQPPLRRRLGPYLAGLITEAATAQGVRFAHHPGGVHLRGSGTPVAELGDGRRFEGDLVLSAVGCAPNLDWLDGTGLLTRGELRIDDRCRAGENIVAAGDVAAFPVGAGHRRTPWWNSALEQARTAAIALLDGDAAPKLTPSPMFWTEQFGLSIRVCGPLPVAGEPAIVDGQSVSSGLLLRWPGENGEATAAAVNKRIPITRLRALTGPRQEVKQ